MAAAAKQASSLVADERLLEILHHPDIAAARMLAVEEYPFSIWRPDRIVDADARVGELEDLFRRAALHGRNPEHAVVQDVHDARAVGREGDVRSALLLGELDRLAPRCRHQHRR